MDTWPDGGRHEKRRDAPWATLAELAVGLLDHRQSADPRPDQATDALGLLFRQRAAMRKAGILYGLDRCGHAVMDEGVHVARFLGRDVILDLEALYLASNAACEGRRVEFPVERVISLTVLHRLFAPGSDCAAEKWKDDYSIEVLDNDNWTCTMSTGRWIWSRRLCSHTAATCSPI